MMDLNSCQMIGEEAIRLSKFALYGLVLQVILFCLLIAKWISIRKERKEIKKENKNPNHH